MRPVTFLSDYGYDDEFAGVCRGVIAAIAPGAPIVDITHGIPAHDVARGAFALAAALPHGPEGVHLAVVDPGVGTSRRGVAVSAAGGAHVLVGPDNGLLWPALERLGGGERAFDLTGSPFCRVPVSATFHGRDVFAPVAAHLAAGADLEQAGEPIEVDSLARPAEARPVVDDHHVVARIAYVDGFGNAVLDLPGTLVPDELFAPGDEVEVEVGGQLHRARFARTFGEVAEGAPLVYVDGTESLAIAVNRGRAADLPGVERGEQVLVRRAR